MPGTDRAPALARKFLLLGAINGFLAVALGAFGAHALKGQLDNHATAIYSTASDYHLAHALALLATGILMQQYPARAGFSRAGWLLFAGQTVFCGSLYLLAITGAGWLGMVTPLGGGALLLGWLTLAITVWRAASSG